MPAKKLPQHSFCQKVIEKKVRHRTLNLVTGESADAGEWETVTEPCGVPLFSNDDRIRGRCRQHRED